MQYSISWQKSDFEQANKLCYSYENLYIRYSEIFRKFYLQKRSHPTFERPDWLSTKEMSKNEIQEALAAGITFWSKKDEKLWSDISYS